MSNHRDDLDFMSLRRAEDESKPMSAWARRKLELGKWFSCCALPNGQGGKVSQIRIPPTEEPQRNVLAGMRHACHFQFHDLIVWQINTSYSQFFAYALLWYLIWVNIFTVIIYGAVEGAWAAGIECITTFEFERDSPSSDLHQNMEYAFELSWTTFSTVGYGAISPSGGNAGCYWVRYICAIEAFIGVIYFGFCGAIFFAKITRILARAPVTFSSTLCVQYDTRFSGSENNSTEKKSEGNAVSSIVTKNENSFPVLEFRIVNDKANIEGWEILEAAVNCMISIDISKDEMPTNGERQLIHASSNICDSPTGSSSELFSVDLGADETNHHMRDVPVSKQVFHKLEMEAESHPYFKRVWYCRHVLNEQSPLLTGEMRSKIKQNGGHWPSYVNTHEEVRSALVNFNTIIITLKGTLNRTSSDIFIEKRYNYEDLCVGYKFAGLLFLKEHTVSAGVNGKKKKVKEQKVQVDCALVHDIVPQSEGGAEPLINREKYVAAACDSPKFVSVV